METGDLFSTTARPEVSPREEPSVLSVTELTRKVRGLLESGVGTVWVSGEISNYRRQASGHQYFTLKDDRCQLSCVMFHRPYRALRQIPLAEGMQVQVRGELTVYEVRGQYQLNVSLVQAAGVGLLAARFEALKRKLEAEGLFETSHKMALPKLPRCVGIVTSPTGAAIRDMLNILHRRAPWVRIIINPARVQGAGAGAEIAAGVREFNRAAELGLPGPDVIVVCRGGGSAEDLWEFNDESLARTIFESSIPVVSAVGHEVDFTISDFVADLRAPTPSAAAELIVPDTAGLLERLSRVRQALHRRAVASLQAKQNRRLLLAGHPLFREPQRFIREASQTVDMLGDRLLRGARQHIEERRSRVVRFAAVLRERRPVNMARLKRGQLSALSQRIRQLTQRHTTDAAARLKRVSSLLNVLSPQTTLQRGFSITTAANGRLILSVEEVNSDLAITTRVKDGSFRSRVIG